MRKYQVPYVKVPRAIWYKEKIKSDCSREGKVWEEWKLRQYL
jgi:hypothetical protein